MVQVAAAASATPGLLPAHLASQGAKGRLLETAVELFSARGYHGVSVRDITSHMGVQASSLYAQYRSKEELFSELVYLANEEMRARLREALLASEPRPAAQLRTIVRCYVEFHTAYPQLATLAHNDLNLLSGLALHRVSTSRKEASMLLYSVIARGNETGDFTCANPWMAVAAIAAIGIRIASWYQPPGQDTRDADSFAAEVSGWMGQAPTVPELVATYSDYALLMVRNTDFRETG
jgi:AcrR family transcriptional regulator